MNEVVSGLSSRKRVRRPWDSMATPGQNVSSNRKNTFRRAMMTLRAAKARMRRPSARRPYTHAASASELNEHLLQVGLAHLASAHQAALLVHEAQDLGQPLLRGIDGEL